MFEMLNSYEKQLLVWAKLEENRPHNRTGHANQEAFKLAITGVLRRNADIIAIKEGRPPAHGKWSVFCDGNPVLGANSWNEEEKGFWRWFQAERARHLYAVSRLGVLHRVHFRGQWTMHLPKYEGATPEDLRGYEAVFQQALAYNRLTDVVMMIGDSLSCGNEQMKTAIKAALRKGAHHDLITQIHDGVKENDEFWDQFEANASS